MVLALAMAMMYLNCLIPVRCTILGHGVLQRQVVRILDPSVLCSPSARFVVELNLQGVLDKGQSAWNVIQAIELDARPRESRGDSFVEL